MFMLGKMKLLTCCGMASAHTPKIRHFRGVRKYIGPGWKGVMGVVNLLGEIKGVVGNCGGWCLVVIIKPLSFKSHLCVMDLCLVVTALFSGQHQMSFLVSKFLFLLILTNIWWSDDGCVVGLACCTEIRHRLWHDDMGAELSPDVLKRCQADNSVACKNKLK